MKARGRGSVSHRQTPPPPVHLLLAVAVGNGRPLLAHLVLHHPSPAPRNKPKLDTGESGRVAPLHPIALADESIFRSLTLGAPAGLPPGADVHPCYSARSLPFTQMLMLKKRACAQCSHFRSAWYSNFGCPAGLPGRCRAFGRRGGRGRRSGHDPERSVLFFVFMSAVTFLNPAE